MSEAQQTLRIGVVGAGGAAAGHIEAFQTLPSVEVVAISGGRAARAAATQARFGIAARYDDYQALIAHPGLDAVSVATPNALHAPVTLAALAAGKHVLCEKPLAVNASAAAAMVTAAEGAGRVLQVIFNHRERGDVQALQAQVASGTLGRIYLAKAFWRRRSGIPGIGAWFTQRALAGGGALIDLGVHMLDIALWCLGEPQVLTASAATYAELGPHGQGEMAGWPGDPAGGFDVEDLATALLRLDSGATLLLETAWALHGPDHDSFGLTLHGTRGAAELVVRDYATSDTLALYHDLAEPPAVTAPDLGPSGGYLPVIERFAATIRSGGWAGAAGHDGLRRAQILDACYESARLGREVVIGA